jgi:hypothetical protein
VGECKVLEKPPNAVKKGKRQTPCGKCAGKNVSKNQHGHLASMAQADLVTPDPAPVTIVTGSGKIIKPMLEQCLTTALMVPNPLPIPMATPLTRDPRKQQPVQHFVSVSPLESESSVYPEYQHAHNALESLDLAKTARNLKLFEATFAKREGKKRKIKYMSDDNNVSLGSYPNTDDLYMETKESAHTDAAIMEAVDEQLNVWSVIEDVIMDRNDYNYQVENGGYDYRLV